MPYKRRASGYTPNELATARNEVRNAWSRALNETRAAAKMSDSHPPAEVEALARDVVARALSALSIEARERVVRALGARYIPAPATSPHVVTVGSRAAGSNRE